MNGDELQEGNLYKIIAHISVIDPGRNPAILKPGEIITCVSIQKRTVGFKCFFLHENKIISRYFIDKHTTKRLVKIETLS